MGEQTSLEQVFDSLPPSLRPMFGASLMDNRPWFWLLLLTSFSALSAPFAAAQPGRLQRTEGSTIIGLSNQSHHDLPGGPDGNNAEEMMAQRLRELQQLHQLQDQVQDLLKD